MLTADRRRHRRHVQPGERRRRADRDLQVDRPRVQARQEAARGDGAVRGRRRAPPRARLGALDRSGSGGWSDVSFAWPLALLSLLVVPAAPRDVLVEPAAPAQAGRSLLERRAPALGAAAAEALAAAPAGRPAPRRTRRARRLPPAGRTSCASVPIARTSIILALDVSRSMCSTDVKPNRLAVAQEAARAFVQKQPHGVRMGLVVFSGLRRADRAADDRPQGARGGDRRPHDGARHRDRLGDAEGARRDRRGEPERRSRRRLRPRPSRPPRVDPGQPAGQRLRAGHHRAAHRRRQQPRHRAARRGSLRGRAPGARLPDRLRHRQPVAARRARASSSAATSSTPAASAAAAAGFGGGSAAGAGSSSPTSRR